MSKYKPGQHVYILASNCVVQEVIVRSNANRIYTVSLPQVGMIDLPEKRLHADRESADEHMRKVRAERRNRLSYMEKIAEGML